MRLRQVVVLVAGAAVSVLALSIARAHPGESLAGAGAAGDLVLLGAGWALLVCGVAAWVRRPASRCGPLLAAAGIAWLLPELNNPDVGSSLVFTIGLVAFAACPAFVAHAALAYPGGRLASRSARSAVAAAYVGAIAVLGLGPALLFDPGAQGCAACPANLLAVASEAGAVRTLERTGLWIGVATSVALAVLAVVRVARSSAAARHVTAPVLLAAAAYLALVAADDAHGLARGFVSNDAVDRRLWIAQGAALVLLAAGVAWAWVRQWRARTSIARLTVELGETPPAGRLRDALARALADPDLALAYPLDDERHVDGDGRTIALRRRDGQATTVLRRGGRPVALLVHRASLLDDPGLVEEVGAAAGLALNHERLQAEVRARLADLRASRARTIEAADAERRRLERDLHDGAQQRLVVLSLALRLLRGQVDGAAAAHVNAADAQLQSALLELHELARGIYPAVLAEEGLGVAIEALAEGAAVPIVTTRVPDERFAPPVESAAYFLVAEVLRRSRTAGLGVGVHHDRERLVVDIDGVGPLDDDLIDLQDRIGALDGSLAVVRDRGGRVAIRAEIPCAS